MGLLFGRAFGKQLDQGIQADPWFKRRHRVWRELLRRILDFTHHFWVGLLLVVYLPDIPEAVWFGWGLFVDDMPDLPRRVKGYFKTGSESA